jgi:aminoglycoside phosphotransferase (APT) family kinase protein
MAELDLSELAARVNGAAQAWCPGVQISGLEPLAGGNVGLVYVADVTDGPPEHPRLVLKVAPPGLPPVRNRDMIRQGRLMRALHGQPGVRVPALLFDDLGDPPETPPFIAMSFIVGECYEPILDATNSPRPHDDIHSRAIEATQMLVALHALVPSTIGLGDDPITTLTDEVERWTRSLETVDAELSTGFRECHDALLATKPDELDPVVVHGDYRLGNTLSQDGSVEAVIDWEIWTLSDPRVDLAWFLFFADQPDHPIAAANTPGLSGMPTIAALLAEYEQLSGRHVEHLDWFHALTRYKEAGATALIVKHMRRRPDPSPMIDHMAEVCPALIAEAHTILARA